MLIVWVLDTTKDVNEHWRFPLIYTHVHNPPVAHRYSIERVYREKKLFGSHPKELTECAFDIVTNAPTSLQPDAEILHLVTEIINEFPELQVSSLYISSNVKGQSIW